MYKALQISPMIPSFETNDTVSFFNKLLEFEIEMHESNYAILIKDKYSIHILPAGENIGQMEIYLQVDNVDEIWANIKDKLDGITFKKPFDRDYGMREIHIEIPGTKTLLFIGQNINR